MGKALGNEVPDAHPDYQTRSSSKIHKPST